MCISFCHRREVLFLNHEDCPPSCPHAWEEHGRCRDCRHRMGDLCGLTRMPLPDAGGCCHFNVEVVTEPQRITRADVFQVPRWMGETVVEVLEEFGVPHRKDARGVLVDPARCVVPGIYGLGGE